MADLDEKELGSGAKPLRRGVKIKPQAQEPADPVEETAAAKAAPTPTETLGEHTVVAGETLSAISTQYYNSPNHYMKIYEANKDVIGNNPNLIRVGQVLKIPK